VEERKKWRRKVVWRRGRWRRGRDERGGWGGGEDGENQEAKVMKGMGLWVVGSSDGRIMMGGVEGRRPRLIIMQRVRGRIKLDWVGRGSSAVVVVVVVVVVV
jgi:hypothetical protein